MVTAIDTDSQPITVVVFSDETREFVLQRHRQLRPDHAGRPVRFEHRREPRTEHAEMFAVHMPDEPQAVLDRIEAVGRGLTVADAGGCASLATTAARLRVSAQPLSALWVGRCDFRQCR